jgi:uncharacterized protein DUF4149
MLRILALALWLGGTAVLDFIEAPLRFASGVITRNQAVALGQLVISWWGRVEWGLGVIALVATLAAPIPRWSTWLLVALVAIVTVQTAYLAPAITHLAQGLDFVQRTPGDPRYSSIRHLHTAYAVLEIVVLAGVGLLLAAVARAAAR